MTLYLIGMGLEPQLDITIYALEIIKQCKEVYLIYSEIYRDDINVNDLCGCNVVPLQIGNLDQLFDGCFQNSNIAILLPGDPFESSFFPQIKMKAENNGIHLKVIHNTSIFNGVGSTGLQLYKFGNSSVVDLKTELIQWNFDLVNKNLSKGLHSLIIFKGKEPRKIDGQTLSNFFSHCSLVNEDTIFILASRIGSKDQKLIKMSVKDLVNSEEFIIKSPSCLIVCSELHPMELEVLDCLSNYFDVKSNQNSLPHSISDLADSDKNMNEGSNSSTFHLIGLGLGQPKDVSIGGKLAIEKSEKVFLEGYTSVMIGGKEILENFFEREIIVADREMVEQNSDEIVPSKKVGDVALLVVGDPLGATTHTDLLQRAVTNGYEINIVHNASIVNSAAVCGLNIHNFGEIISIPFWDGDWKPDSFYDKIINNLKDGLHTLCLLDIKVKEQTVENLMRGNKIFEPPRFMTVKQASEQLINIVKNKGLQDYDSFLKYNSEVVGLARIGTDSEAILLCSLEEMAEVELGGPLHSLIIVGNKCDLENEVLRIYKHS